METKNILRSTLAHTSRSPEASGAAANGESAPAGDSGVLELFTLQAKLGGRGDRSGDYCFECFTGTYRAYGPTSKA